MIKYVVEVKQTFKWSNEVVAEFDDLSRAVSFAELMMKTLKNTTVTISTLTEQETETEGTNE